MTMNPKNQPIEQRRQQITSGLAKGDQLLAYLDCGVETSAQGNAGVGLHQLNGQGWSYPGADAVAAMGVPYRARA